MVNSRMSKSEIQAEIKRLELLIADCNYHYTCFAVGGYNMKDLTELDNTYSLLKRELDEAIKLLALR